MFKNLWEFMDQSVKARIIFCASLAVVVLAISVPYFVSVLSHSDHRPEVASEEVIEPVDATEPEVAEEPVAEPESTEPVTDAEPTEESQSYASNSDYYTYTPSSTTHTSSTSSTEPIPTVVATPDEPATTVDSTEDSGYTPAPATPTITVDDPCANGACD